MRKIGAFVVTALAGLAMALGLTMASGAPAQAATYRMQIYEIWYNSPGPDYGGNTSLDHEWVKLHNTSAASISLTHWTLRDKQVQVLSLPGLNVGQELQGAVRCLPRSGDV